MPAYSLPYDPSDADSIVEYVSLLVGSTLREHVDVSEIADPKQRKGSFGNAVEYQSQEAPESVLQGMGQEIREHIARGFGDGYEDWKDHYEG
jgi:hypothetical protein